MAEAIETEFLVLGLGAAGLGDAIVRQLLGEAPLPGCDFSVFRPWRAKAEARDQRTSA